MQGQGTGETARVGSQGYRRGQCTQPLFHQLCVLGIGTLFMFIYRKYGFGIISIFKTEIKSFQRSKVVEGTIFC